MATYAFVDNGKTLEITSGTVVRDLKKEYITIYTLGDIVYLRYQDRENKNARYELPVDWNDITAPVVTSAVDAETQLNAFLTPTGGSPSYTDANFGTFGASLGAAVPNNADVVITVDGTTAKKITWTNVKAFLKTYFDAIYTTTAAVATQISTALSGYLTSAAAAAAYQPLDSDLTDIAGIAPANDDIIQRKSGAWTNRTLAQLKTDLALSDLYDTSITEVSGTATTAEELLVAFTINGGDAVDGDTVVVRALVTHSSSSGSQKVWRIRVDTSATGTTGTIVAEFQNNSSSGATIPLKIWQDIKCKANGGNTLETAYTNAGAFAQGVLAILAVANINLANNWYIKITSDKAVTGDTMTFKYGDVLINKT